MKLQIVNQKNRTYYYIAKTLRFEGKSKTRIIKRLGSEEEICKQHNVKDAEKWAKNELKKINGAQKYNTTTKTSYHLISEILNQIGLRNIIHDANDLEVFKFIVWNIICFPNKVNFNYEGFSKYSNTRISNNKIVHMLKNMNENFETTVETTIKYYLSKFKLPNDELYVWSGQIYTPFLFTNSKEKSKIPTSLYFSSEGIPAYLEHDDDLKNNLKDLLYKKVSDVKFINHKPTQSTTSSSHSITEINYSENRKFLLEIEKNSDIKWKKVRFRSIASRTSAKSYLMKYKRITGKIKNKDFIIIKSNAIEDLDYLMRLFSIQGLTRSGETLDQNINNYIPHVDYNDFGYRAYIAPKNIDISLIATILYATIEYQATFNWNYLDIAKILVRNNSIKTIRAYQLVQFISILTRAVLYCYSAYDINNMWTMSWFMKKLDKGEIDDVEIKRLYQQICTRLFEA